MRLTCPRPILRPLAHAFAAFAFISVFSGRAIAQLESPPLQYWPGSAPGLDLPGQAGAYFGEALAAGDFDCDGFDDLAVGIPGFDAGGVNEAGAVLILYGGPAAFVSTQDSAFSEADAEITGEPDAFDHFGEALATGDFDGDGCDDLAIGSLGEEILGADNAGAVHILYGGALGLSADGDQIWSQAGIVAEDPELNDFFGAELAAGDFDFPDAEYDGYDDLAIAAPGESLGEDNSIPNAGVVIVLRGSAAGLTATGNALVARGVGNVEGPPEAGEYFGSALAAAEMTATDGDDELLIGCPGRSLSGGIAHAGEVILPVQLGAGFVFQMNQNAVDTPGVAEEGDGFGSALALGDFNGDTTTDVAIGVPGEDLETGQGMIAGVGAVNVVYWSSPKADELWLQNDLPTEESETDDHFGSVLTAGDFDADGYDELVIGVPGENVSTLVDAGVVHVVPGGPGGLSATGDQLWLQLLDPSEAGDRFGGGLAAGRFSGHSGLDLAIAAPSEAGENALEGAFNLFYSAALFLDGFETGGTTQWSFAVP
jgi:hypothetical protein